MSTPLSILQQYWKHTSFRPMQEAIVQSVLERKDVLALLPTGGGKSICFQVPALMMEGICLVISPLIALMRDQVAHLNEKAIPAIALDSSLPHHALRSILQSCTRGDYKFLYLSPERLESTLFREYLPALDVSLIAVDEAHCVSQWGYDFRPPYLRIAALRKELPGVPVIALTASATEMVQQDIVDKLAFGTHKVFRQSFNRPALSYSCFLTDSKINKVVRILSNVPGSSIVYCKSRKQTKEVAQLLQLQGISANWYHAGLSTEERQEKQAAWIKDHTRVMVCTNAFGMGIDKPTVRTVIHYDIPDCLENYYQEAGRAGRDGKKAFATLLYQESDIQQLIALPEKRFPAITTIRSVYQSLADYLQIPVGTGEGGYFDFDIQAFTSNFKLDAYLVINVLKVLEQEGHIGFEESIFLPSQVAILANKDDLFAFTQHHQALEPLVKCLLRTYEGIIDHRVAIFEKQIARILRTEQDQVKGQLKQLASFGLIEYLPQKDTPQIHFILNRAPANYLHIDQDAYQLRKQRFTDRVRNMLQYLQNPNNCRSVFIGRYFGDKELTDCGICDHCLEKKRTTLSATVVAQIEAAIREQLNQGVQNIGTLIAKLSSIPSEHIWAVLQLMQEEGLLQINEEGKLALLHQA